MSFKTTVNNPKIPRSFLIIQCAQIRSRSGLRRVLRIAQNNPFFFPELPRLSFEITPTFFLQKGWVIFWTDWIPELIAHGTTSANP